MQPAVRGDILHPFLRAAIDSTSMNMIHSVGAATRQANGDIWNFATRFMPPEYVGLIEALVGLGKALCPLQMSIFENMSNSLNLVGDVRGTLNPPFQAPRSILQRLDETTPRTIDENVSMEERRRLLRERTARFDSTIADRVAGVNTRSTDATISGAGSTNSTADSWRTGIPADEVSGDDGWELRAIQAIKEAYGYEVTAEIRGLKRLKECLCKATQALVTADERVRQLLTIRANAMRQKNSVNELLRANSPAVTSVQTTAETASKALGTLADDVVKAYESARKEAISCKQQLYMLQHAWTAAIGGGNASLVPVCGICLQRGVDTVCTPCGHTFCETCAVGIGKQPNSSRYTPAGPCHVCRGVVQTKQKIYFS